MIRAGMLQVIFGILVLGTPVVPLLFATAGMSLLTPWVPYVALPLIILGLIYCLIGGLHWLRHQKHFRNR